MERQRLLGVTGCEWIPLLLSSLLSLTSSGEEPDRDGDGERKYRENTASSSGGRSAGLSVSDGVNVHPSP